MEKTKEQVLREKLSNFIKFVKENIGTQNNIYEDLIAYEKNFETFLQHILQVAGFAKQNENGNWSIEETYILKYLEAKGIAKKLSKEIITKINRYFAMFLKLLNC